jgi:hypothetical protein
MSSKNKNTTRKTKNTQAQWFRLSGTHIAVGLISLGLLALVAVIIYGSGIGQPPKVSAPAEGVIEYHYTDGQHQEGLIAYDLIPPAGGKHNPRWQNCGVYDQPIASELAVHSLEHGAVWITYQPDIAASEVTRLQTITRQSQYRLLSPYPNLPSPIVASAWGYQLKLTKADDPRLMQFIKAYEQNPLGPEPGAICAGGIGTPK